MGRIDKKAVLGWCMYDWANSAFATVVIAGFFPIFFKEYWSTGVDTTVSTARLGLANSIAGLSVAILAPVLGAIGDRANFIKRFLFLFAYLGVLMTGSLYFISKGNWPAAFVVYIIAVMGFSAANIFYDALLKNVAVDGNEHFVSSLGFSLGYLGGGLLFAFSVYITMNPQAAGLKDASGAMKLSFICVALWWALFSIPLFLFVKENDKIKSKAAGNPVKDGLIQLKGTLKELITFKPLLLFLLAYWFYMDGVGTIIRMATGYGLSIGFEPKDLIIALLLTQFIGFPSALLFGLFGVRIGAKKAILTGISVYLLVCIWGAFMKDVAEFYMIAVLVGLVQGGIQALSRSFYARQIPAGKSAQYFGLYNMVGKFAAVLGPVLMGGVGVLLKRGGMSSDSSSRISITSIALLFIAGGILLCLVREKDMNYQLRTDSSQEL
ncbi:MFS transporter [Elusimicrobiota bacterium]